MHTRTRTTAAALLIAVTAAAAACGGGVGEGAGQVAVTGTDVSNAATTAAPAPITAAERRWLKSIKLYDSRLVAEISGGTSVVTAAALRRAETMDERCTTALRSAGPAGRFKPARRQVRQACRMLGRAAGDLRTALATGLISGAIVSDGDLVAFQRSLNDAFTTEGNATGVLAKAIAHAQRIRKQFG